MSSVIQSISSCVKNLPSHDFFSAAACFRKYPVAKKIFSNCFETEEAHRFKFLPSDMFYGKVQPHHEVHANLDTSKFCAEYTLEEMKSLSARDTEIISGSQIILTLALLGTAAYVGNKIYKHYQNKQKQF